MESYQPGWYKDPYGAEGMVRYWDGASWSNQSRPLDQLNARPGGMGREPSNGMVRFAIVAANILKGLQGIVWMGIGLFLLLAVLCTVFGMGGWRLAGTTLVEWGSRVGMFSTLGVIAISLVVIPLIYELEYIVKKKVAFELVRDSENEFGPDRQSIAFGNSFLSLARIERNGATISSVLGAILGLMAHDPLMDAIGNPGADIVTILVVFVSGVVLTSLIAGTFAKRYKRKHPECVDMG